MHLKFYVKHPIVLHGHMKEINTVSTNFILCIYSKVYCLGNMWRLVLANFSSSSS